LFHKVVADGGEICRSFAFSLRRHYPVQVMWVYSQPEIFKAPLSTMTEKTVSLKMLLPYVRITGIRFKGYDLSPTGTPLRQSYGFLMIMLNRVDVKIS